MTSLPPLSFAARQGTPSFFGTTAQHVRSAPHFGGDALQIRNATPPQSDLSNPFREVCETVVGEGVVNGKKETLTVVEMIPALCEKSGDYPGYGSPAKLAKTFSGTGMKIDVDKLANGFRALYYKARWLGLSGNAYWLSPNGAEEIQRFYPGINLPPERERFTPTKVGDFYR